MKIKSILCNKHLPFIMFFVGFFGYAIFIFYALAQSKKGNIIIPNLVNFQILIGGIAVVSIKLANYIAEKKMEHEKDYNTSSSEITPLEALLANVTCLSGGILMALCPLMFIVR